MTYNIILNVINKPWLSTKDIMILANCGRNTAIKIRKEVEELIKASGYKLPSAKVKKVPTDKVLEYLHLDVNYIITMANYYEGD